MSGILDFAVYLSNTVNDSASSTVTCILTDNRKIFENEQFLAINDQGQNFKTLNYVSLYGDVMKENELTGKLWYSGRKDFQNTCNAVVITRICEEKVNILHRKDCYLYVQLLVTLMFKTINKGN